ncbi:DUF86 domain-containing protein [Patescibacteria group bacterium]
MSPLDKQLLVRKAKLIEEDLNKLQEFEKISLKKYQQSLETRLQVERLLERIVGRVIDINYHLLKQEFDYLPQDYYQSFLKLAEKKILSKKFAAQIAQSTGLRNALAHDYDVVDDQQVFEAIKRCLLQVPKYLKIVLDRF